MNRREVWNTEYGNKSKLLSKSKEPQVFIKRLFKFLRKRGFNFSEAMVLDLGCGNGRNLIYFSEHGTGGVGIDISDNAIIQAKNSNDNPNLNFKVGNVGVPWDLPDDNFDLVLDVTATNALSGVERAVYLSEVARVLKPDGYFFVRALCLESDKNAKKLLKIFPGQEADTYIMPEVGLVERVFSRKDFIETYQDFKIIELKKETSYSRIGSQKYKRNFWLAIMQKSTE